MSQKPQHVGNISSDIPYVLTLLYHIGHCLDLKKSWRDVSEGETHPAQFEFAYNTMGQNT